MKWTYDKENGRITGEIGEVARVTLNGDATNANGLLLAAAPELLEALEKAVNLLIEHYNSHSEVEHGEEEGDSDIWELEDVVAKVKGGKPK